MGVRVPAPGRNSNLNALPRAKRARHQCHAWSAIRHDSSRVGSGDLPGPALGVVVARVARHAQVQEMALSIRQDMDLGAEAASFLGRARRARVCGLTELSSRTADRSGPACRPSGAARRPGFIHRLSDDRPSSPSRRG